MSNDKSNSTEDTEDLSFEESEPESAKKATKKTARKTSGKSGYTQGEGDPYPTNEELEQWAKTHTHAIDAVGGMPADDNGDKLLVAHCRKHRRAADFLLSLRK